MKNQNPMLHVRLPEDIRAGYAEISFLYRNKLGKKEKSIQNILEEILVESLEEKKKIVEKELKAI